MNGDKGDVAFNLTSENTAKEASGVSDVVKSATKVESIPDRAKDLIKNVTIGAKATFDPMSDVVDQLIKGITQWNTDQDKLTNALKLAAPRWPEFAGFMRGKFGDDLLELGAEALIFKTIDTVIMSSTQEDGTMVLTNAQVWYIVGKLSVFAEDEIKKFIGKMIPFFGTDLLNALKIFSLV